MASRNDLLQAKRSLSSSFLKARTTGLVTAHSISVESALGVGARNIHAVGVGRKIVEGQSTEVECVRVYVVQKMAESLLPPMLQVPATIDGIPTDVIESPPAFLMAGPPSAGAMPTCSTDRKKKQRPVVAGISGGHIGVTAGTIGYFCYSTRDGDDPDQVFALSNNHVFANLDSAAVGDPILQQSVSDGGGIADQFAKFARAVPILLGGTLVNRVDAAIARVVEPFRGEICSIGSIGGTQQGAQGLEVRKHGRTSGYTEGVVEDDSYDVLVGLDHNDPNKVGFFEDQLRIQAQSPYPAFGLGGDSGSLVVTKHDDKAVGLYFAGPASGTYGIANHIDDVLKELEIRLL